MKKLSIITLLILSSCYTPVDDPTRFDVTGFESYWQKLKADAIANGFIPREDNLVILMVYGLREQCNCLALTSYTEPGKHQVTVFIDANWYWLHPETRETIFYHEMGHAMMRRKNHVTYFSLMNPTISDHDWPVDSLRKKELITELFHPQIQY